MRKFEKVTVFLDIVLIYFSVCVSFTCGEKQKLKVFPMWSSRYIRSTMGKALLLHMAESQQREQDVDHTLWYHCKRAELSAELNSKFMESDLDADTEEFLDNCHSKADAAFTQVIQHFIKGILSLVISATTINGLLNRGSMFVLSGAQFRTLVDVSQMLPDRRLLDLGAGDGKVTDVMQPHFDKVYVTEQSPSMRWRLSSKGYKLLDVETWVNAMEKFDVVSCLNLLDRCDKPLTLLSNIRRVLRSKTGRVVIAVVLPFRPCVESGSHLVPPSELITLKGNSWEEQAASLVSDVFMPAGYKVEKFTRLPYLCEGDIYQDYYILDDAVFVLKSI